MAKELYTFIDIEKQLQKLSFNRIQPIIEATLKEVVSLIDKGDFSKAKKVLSSMSFGEVPDKEKKKLYFFLVNALVFGSSNVASVSNSIFLKEDSLPSFLGKVSDLFFNILNKAALDFAVESGKDAIDSLKKNSSIKKAVDQSFVDELNNAVMTGAKIVNDIGANLTTSRLVSYGFLAEASALGVLKYQLQAVLDERTSDVCQRLHGLVFDVEKSFSFLQEVLEITDPEKLKSIAPFVKSHKAALHELENLSAAELQAKGVMVPPFHPHCRTILVKVGDADISSVSYTPVDILISNEPVVYKFPDGDDFWEWANSNYKEPSVKQSVALTVYQQANLLNDKIRKNGFSSLKGVDKKIATAIDSSIKNHVLSEDIVLYRGIENVNIFGEDDLKNLLGAIIKDKGYVSASGLSKTAKVFLKGSENGAVIEMVIPKGANFTIPNLYTKNKMYTDEFEVMLQRGSKFVVTDIDKKWTKIMSRDGEPVYIPKITVKWYK